MLISTLIVFLVCFLIFAGMFIYILFRLSQIEEKIDELESDSSDLVTTHELNKEIDTIIGKEELSNEISKIIDR